MKRLQYHRYGGPDVLALEDTATPLPGRRQVLVRVRAAAANAMNWKMRNGEMRAMTGRKFPRGVGHDFAGIIERVGRSSLESKPVAIVSGQLRYSLRPCAFRFAILQPYSMRRQT